MRPQDSAEALRDANALLAARTRDNQAARADIAQRQAHLDVTAAALAVWEIKFATRRDVVWNPLTKALSLCWNKMTCKPASADQT